jgi:hypothetical protein
MPLADQIVAAQVHQEKCLIKTVFEVVDVTIPQRVIDLGCG